MSDGEMRLTRISRGTGTLWERFWCRVFGGHKRGVPMPEWSGGPGFICPRCGGIYQWTSGPDDYDENGHPRPIEKWWE